MTTTVLASFRIEDWDHWRAGYANAVSATAELRSWRIWRGQDDPTYVVIAETFDSREIAENAFTSEETRRMMAADGIDMSTLRIEYLDEVD